MTSKIGSQNLVLDVLTILAVAIIHVATGVIGSVLNIGTGKLSAELLIDVSALDTADGNETYVLELRGSDDAFAGTDKLLASVEITALGRQSISFNNVADGIICSSIRLVGTLGGTTPSITVDARLGNKAI